MNKTLEQLYKIKRVLEQRLHNFIKRDNIFKGNFANKANKIVNLRKRVEKINLQIITQCIIMNFDAYWDEEN